MNYRKLRKIDLAVLHCLNTSKDWIGKQPSAAIRRFFAVDDQFLFEVEIRNISLGIHFSVPCAYYIARGIFMKKSLV